MGVASKTLFSLKDVAIKKPADAEWLDIPYVIQASYKGSHATVEIMGDDAHLGNLYHTQKGQITVKANKAAMAVLEKVTGSTAISSGGIEKISIHQDTELSAPPTLCVKATVRGVATTTGDVVLYFYKTLCTTTFETFFDFAQGKMAELTMTFDCFMSTTDENNTALATNAFGRLEIPTAA